MTTVVILLSLPTSYLDQFVANWDVIDAELEVKAQGSFINSNAARVELSDGKYWARLHLPNNQMDTKMFEVISGQERVDIEFVIPALSQSISSVLDWTAISEEITTLDGLNCDEDDGSLWTRAWHFIEGKWTPSDEALAAEITQEPGFFQISLSPGATGLIALQIAGNNIISSFVVIPPIGLSRILLTPNTDCGVEPLQTKTLNVSVSIANSIADHLARFLTVATPGATSTIEAMLAVDPLNLLSGKIEDPLGAAVGGYFLVNYREQEFPVQWLKNLADWTPWMADGAILYAYACLTLRSESSQDDAYDYLLKASQRGYPVFRKGIDLALDAILMLRSSVRSFQPSPFDSYETLLGKVRDADTRKTVFTTFWGTTPDNPMKSTWGGTQEWTDKSVMAFGASPLELHSAGVDVDSLEMASDVSADYGVLHLRSEPSSSNE
ncbi:MAG: hypothetical protein ACREPB_10775 [Arenimonas sp.]